LIVEPVEVSVDSGSAGLGKPATVFGSADSADHSAASEAFEGYVRHWQASREQISAENRVSGLQGVLEAFEPGPLHHQPAQSRQLARSNT
jgi:hypothetical protein